MTVFGWDASDYDHPRGPMDLGAARRDGIDFFTHKLTEGASVVHFAGPYLARARDAGIPFVGAYMVPRTPGASVSAQVDFFLQQADGQCPWWRDFPGWFWQVDTEHWSYDNVPASVGHEAAQLLEQRTGKVVLHYAPEWAYGGSVPGGEPLWASNYVPGSGPYRALYPGDASDRWHAYSGRTPAVLQYTDSATIGGQPGCDANAFRGTIIDFAKLINAKTPIGVADMALTNDEMARVASWVLHGGDHDGRVLGRPGVNPSDASFIDKTNLEEVERRLRAQVAALSFVPTDAQWASLTTAVVDAFSTAVAPIAQEAAERAIRRVLGGLDA